MAELKKLPRQILESNRPPSFEALAQQETPAEALGGLTSAVSKGIGEYVKYNNELEEKSLLASATTDLTRLSNEYLANPNLDSTYLQGFEQQAAAITSGYLNQSGTAYEKSLQSSLNAQVTKLSTKLAFKAQKNGIKRNRDTVRTGVEMNKMLAVEAVDNGNVEQAAQFLADAESLSAAYIELGGDSSQAQKMIIDARANVLAAEGIAKLRNVTNIDDAEGILSQYARLPNTQVNNEATNQVFAWWNKRKEYLQAGANLANIYNNMQEDPETGIAPNRDQNFNLEPKVANQAVERLAQNIAAQNDYKAKLDYNPGDDENPDWFLDEDVPTNESPDKVIQKSIADTLQSATKREPTLYEEAVATVKVGAKNADSVTKKATAMLLSGSGQKADEAFIALQYINSKDSNLFGLQGEAKAVFSAYKLQRDNDLGTPDEMIAIARDSVQKNRNKNLEFFEQEFKSKYAMTSGSNGFKALSKAADNIGLDMSRMTAESRQDFYNLFYQNFIDANGLTDTALEMTRIDMSKTHRADKFNRIASGNINTSLLRPFGEIASSVFPPFEAMLGFSSSDFEISHKSVTALNPGLTSNQIQNQLVQQLVDFQEEGGNVILPEHYKKITTATEDDLADKNMAYPPPEWSPELGDIDSGIYLSTKIGESIVEGRFYLRPINITEQNDLGKTIYEGYIQDRNGFDHPVPDSKSPTNVKLFAISNMSEFLPNRAKSMNQENIDKMVKKNLKLRSEELYPIMDVRVSTSKKRWDYRQSIENQKAEERKIRKNMGLAEEEATKQ